MMDIVDSMLKINSDEIVNKILYYLSKLPIQLSFTQMQGKLEGLCEKARFIDYIKAW